MKLSNTGSFHNYLGANVVNCPLEVGLDATIFRWTDRNAAHVTEVFKKGKYTYFKIMQDDRRAVSGEWPNVVYEPVRRTDGPTYTYRLEKDGSRTSVYLNEETGRYNKYDGPGCLVGHAEIYVDPHF